MRFWDIIGKKSKRFRDFVHSFAKKDGLRFSFSTSMPERAGENNFARFS
jgi:hypothetical protein